MVIIVTKCTIRIMILIWLEEVFSYIFYAFSREKFD